MANQRLTFGETTLEDGRTLTDYPSILSESTIQMVQLYSITIHPTEHGKVTANKAYAAAGERVTLTVEPDEGYRLDNLTLEHNQGTLGYSADFSFDMTNSDVTVSATFKECDHAKIEADGKCKRCGMQLAASVTVNGEATNYETLGEAEAAVKAADAGAKIVVTLLADAADAALWLGDDSAPITGKTVTVELNGKTLRSIYVHGGRVRLNNGALAGAAGLYALEVRNGADVTAKNVTATTVLVAGSYLELLDCQITGVTDIRGGALTAEESGFATYILASESENRKSAVTLTGCATEGYLVTEGGTLTMTGGTVTAANEFAIGLEASGDQAVLDDCTVTGASGIAVLEGASLTVKGGNITATDAEGLAIHSNGTVALSGSVGLKGAYAINNLGNPVDLSGQNCTGWKLGFDGGWKDFFTLPAGMGLYNEDGLAVDEEYGTTGIVQPLCKHEKKYYENLTAETHTAVCEICEAPLGEEKHSYTDGVCVCGWLDPATMIVRVPDILQGEEPRISYHFTGTKGENFREFFMFRSGEIWCGYEDLLASLGAESLPVGEYAWVYVCSDDTRQGEVYGTFRVHDPATFATRYEIKALTEAPEALAGKYDSAAKLEEAMFAKLRGYSEKNTALYDIQFQVSYDSGKSWGKADEGNWPAKGITVTIPYPKGSDKSCTFSVVHMFTNEEQLGQMEVFQNGGITKGTEGIEIHVDSFSPFLVAWAKTGKAWPDNPKTGDYIMMAVGAMAVSGVALAAVLVGKKKKK